MGPPRLRPHWGRLRREGSTPSGSARARRAAPIVGQFVPARTATPECHGTCRPPRGKSDLAMKRVAVFAVGAEWVAAEHRSTPSGWAFHRKPKFSAPAPAVL